MPDHQPLRTALALLALAAAWPVAAQQDASDIVVEGERYPPEQAKQISTDILGDFGVAQANAPAARWTEPICLRVVGLSDRQAAIVDARIREAAVMVRAPLARGKCSANAIVSFTGNGADVTSQINRRAPNRMREVPEALRKRYLTDAMPIRWWYSTGIGAADGMAASSVGAPGVFFENSDATANALNISGDEGTIVTHRSSLVSTQVARSIHNATVIVDASQTGGVAIETLADFAALVLLAEVKPGARSSSISVLAAFGGYDPPKGLTDWDMAFLKALYRIPLDRTAGRHRNQLVVEMSKAMSTAKGAKQP
ncbi:MAG: hypothetical protein C0515_02645 [Novosphingobium sp.]|nr:hypothetical protein [Novosphingobium sp.]